MNSKICYAFIIFLVFSVSASRADEGGYDSNKDPYVGMTWKDGTLVPSAPLPERKNEKMQADKKVSDDWLDKVKLYCANKWADDFSMQKYCINKQKTAYYKVNSYKNDRIGKDFDYGETKENPYSRILKKCLLKWINKKEPQWDMVGYCLDKQTSAYEDLYK